MTAPARDDVEQLGERLTDAVARIALLETTLAELQQVVTDTAATLTTRPEKAVREGKGSALDLERLDAWVRGWLLPTFPRRLGGTGGRWCAQWWRHPEAVLRLEALRTSLAELSRAGGTGPGVWLREHLDVQLAVLLSDNGPFAACSAKEGRHDPEESLPAEAIPVELRRGSQVTPNECQEPATSASPPSVLEVGLRR